MFEVSACVSEAKDVRLERRMGVFLKGQFRKPPIAAD
jgi:hypothetical protein